ncbi:hypothetical protein [Saccharibacillus deserti]|uniref:hypothetical protein n=1 Tax=Saccharibacillus deserti TaxID=1634444 RepID=UPI0015552DC0|nr:hypothetical protein [Saccharibacillus deserti]
MRAPTILEMDFREDRLRSLIEFCVRIWAEMPVVLIQSSPENGCPSSLKQIAGGGTPQMYPFVLAGSELAEKVQPARPSIESSRAAKRGVLMIDRSMFPEYRNPQDITTHEREVQTFDRSEKETEPNLTTVRYDERQTEIVESGAEAIEARLRDSDDAGRRSLLFCLDKYLAPYFGYELPYAEGIFGISQREVLRKRSIHVKEDAYELMRMYSGLRLEQLAGRAKRYKELFQRRRDS